MTHRDQELLSALVLKVRLFTLRQIAEHWWHGDLANARRRLKQLATGELLRRLTVPVRTLPLIETPVASWQSAQDPPDFHAVSYRLQRRWPNQPIRPVTAFVATDKSAQFFGAVRRGELKFPTQASHDLGVAAVWLRFRECAPHWAKAWRGEDQMTPFTPGEKRPDALLLNEHGQTTWVIEFGGAYDANRVEEFHRDCARRDLPYQIW